MAASASIGFNAAKPFVQFQISMMRVFAENIEQAARNYEKGFEALSNIIVQQTTESKREASVVLTEPNTRSKDSLGGFSLADPDAGFRLGYLAERLRFGRTSARDHSGGSRDRADAGGSPVRRRYGLKA